ncbi:hypothetical protein Cob_v012111 [Colletotrichum orbiculare MAFF 240422]|uniref:Uncharacterized protein n=1 Tax=Colletotrichum orbiculare (strain 104-T / ATCC 96160 / CBS 514.97 / LARS 414 / MAFF 240422) TaxID=1213857 RepID=A0A484FAJ3_COLOR|nr:hypothetical protein Cob_v012111 [Colletotrichum orbiculare MAFF 240422]
MQANGLPAYRSMISLFSLDWYSTIEFATYDILGCPTSRTRRHEPPESRLASPTPTSLSYGHAVLDDDDDDDDEARRRLKPPVATHRNPARDSEPKKIARDQRQRDPTPR